MQAARVELSRTELDFLHRLLLDLQERPDTDEDAIEALELALAVLRWDGTPPPALDAQVGLGAAVQLRLGPDAMCAYRQWRDRRRKACLIP